MTWTKGMSIKKEYHEKLYGYIDMPIPVELAIKAVISDDQHRTVAHKIENPTPQPSYSTRP